ncbi:MAG: DUF1552 domain-containing protein [Verrucomicrobia bacterium]|nr:DUF1552 domain-containing protein [Verrucomicrobiota bacterium]
MWNGSSTGISSGSSNPNLKSFEFKNRSEFLKVMYDLMLLALRTDATRVITLMSGVEVDSYQWQEVGVNDTYHGIQHHGGNKGSLEMLAKVDKREADLLAEFLKGLHGIIEENGSLLDRTLVV